MRNIRLSSTVIIAANILLLTNKNNNNNYVYGSASISEELLKNKEKIENNDDIAIEGPSSMQILASGEVGYNTEDPEMNERIYLLQGLPDQEVKDLLSAAYSLGLDSDILRLLPYGSVNAIQDHISEPTILDEEKADFVDILQRYALVLQQTVKAYVPYYNAVLNISDPNIDPNEYKNFAQNIPKLSDKWLRESEFLTAFLKKAREDVSAKWGDNYIINKKLSEAVKYVNGLEQLYTLLRRQFMNAYELTRQRFLESKDNKQAILSELWEKSSYKSVARTLEDLREDERQLVQDLHEIGNYLVKESFLPTQFLKLLPFEYDDKLAKQEEEEDEL